MLSPGILISCGSMVGQKIGRPHAINEGGGGFYGPGGWWGGRYGGMSQNIQQSVSSGPSESGGLSLGQITVSASVTVVFELE